MRFFLVYPSDDNSDPGRFEQPEDALEFAQRESRSCAPITVEAVEDGAPIGSIEFANGLFLISTATGIFDKSHWRFRRATR